jgi:hypothetical protein
MLDIHDAMHALRPKHFVPVEEFAMMYIAQCHEALESVLRIQEDVRTLLQAEKQFNKMFIVRKKEYEKKMKLFMDSQLALRRQRSIAKEINTRRKRLIDLRQSRLAAIKAAHDKSVADMKKAAEEKAVADAYKPPRITAQVSGWRGALARAHFKHSRDPYGFRLPAQRRMRSEEPWTPTASLRTPRRQLWTRRKSVWRVSD